MNAEQIFDIAFYGMKCARARKSGTIAFFSEFLNPS